MQKPKDEINDVGVFLSGIYIFDHCHSALMSDPSRADGKDRFSGRFLGGKYYEGAGDVLSFFPTSIIEWFLGTGTKSVQEAFPWEPRKQLMWAGHHGDVNPISSRHLPYVVLRVV